MSIAEGATHFYDTIKISLHEESTFCIYLFMYRGYSPFYNKLWRCPFLRIQDYIIKKAQKTAAKQAAKPDSQANNNSTEDILSKYGKMSEEELMSELFRVGAASNLTDGQLDSFFNNVKQMLTAEQRERMSDLIIQLKNNR